MIVVRVELHSAVDGRTEELGCVVIANVGGTRTMGNYDAVALRKGREARTRAECALAVSGREEGPVTRRARVEGHPRLAQSVWSLVAKALRGMNYG